MPTLKIRVSESIKVLDVIPKIIKFVVRVVQKICADIAQFVYSICVKVNQGRAPPVQKIVKKVKGGHRA
jgi:predicted methyltransferase